MTAPKKSLGQHWLNDLQAIDHMVAAGQVAAGDNVLEIGPGLGVLTEVMLASGASVYAVEFDRDLYEQMKQEVSSLYTADATRLTLYNEDILDFDLDQLPAGYKVVANIPYYITAPIIRTLLEAKNTPQHIALLVQKEVAERVCAKPGKMSILAVSAQFYAECKLAEVVPARAFHPAPKVDSQILIMTPRKVPLFTDIDNARFFRVVKAGFSEKRKKLSNSLSGGLGMEKSEVAKILEDLGFSSNVRAQELTLEQWYELYKKLQI